MKTPINTKWLLTLVFAVLLTGIGKSGQCKASWQVLSGGGNRSLSSKYILQGTTGQTAGTDVSGTRLIVRQGFWQDFFYCGDANADATVNISDAVYLIAYIFAGGLPPNPLLSGDANCDLAVNISDAVYLIAYIFAGGAAPCALCP